METEERRRSRASSSKTPQNGGKRVNGLTTEEEEEARRRELVKEKLRSQLELEKRAQMVVERLLEDSVADDFLAHCAKFITPADYKDAIEERFIAKMCGYPVCPNKLGKIPTQQYRICTRTNKVYDITERKCFCSNFCYKASKEFEVQISKTPLWLRQDESHPEIKLTKKGDGGRSGEEVMLSVRPLQKKDIENLPTAQPEEPHASQQYHAADGLSHSHSDSSDMEQEQDFVSSVVSQQQGRRVHWGDLPKRTDGDDKGKRGKTESIERQNGEGAEEKIEHQQSHAAEKEGKMKEDRERKESSDWPRESSVEEATAKMNVCSLSETVTQTLSPPVNSTPAPAEHTTALISPPFIDSKPPTENKPLPSLTPTTTHLNSNNTTVPTQPGLSITQVGMSKKGAAGLRDLLKNHTVASKPDSVRQNLLECLRRTLKEWSTDETLKFLYGADHPLDYPFTDVREEADGEEELDEDDFEEGLSVEDGRGADAGALMGPPAAAPDYKTMRKETQQLELRVREFYKGTWILPEEGEAPNENKVTVQDWGEKEPVLPLVDSHSQHLIQKRITVEKLTNCLRNIVGSLHLTMSDVSANLNSLVKTFRFTNTNIIHKTPEWTLIALVLLHLLAAVSAVVREALQTTASVEYSNTLMEELGLQEQDLLNLVHMLKPQHPDTHTQ
ncbi:putative RNA polymerase II subunit B1 CTD phosphatase rpap2 isoform X2 [Scophthalmus maximus]|uniref:putative RNA polymerase II subunit B1 CTD phosphatase rpap2 isoform X2 n=1 Tax=Scophthalmus maximus TaxID=52904 RepID=UPI001FA8D702|nr:putative RNA polymerase II subunit B1 CTD phosphatase rpap2 isoform X2 [Scophthalmus maximus]